MDVDDDDEVVAEYPLYAASIRSIYAQNEDMRLVQLQYPTRPPWRGFDLQHIQSVSYKPRHRIIDMKLPEDTPAGVSFCLPRLVGSILARLAHCKSKLVHSSGLRWAKIHKGSGHASASLDVHAAGRRAWRPRRNR